jgi:hypothetical protein
VVAASTTWIAGRLQRGCAPGQRGCNQVAITDTYNSAMSTAAEATSAPPRAGATGDVIDRYIVAIETAAIDSELFSADAVLDATIPNWRFMRCGGGAVAGALAEWFTNPAHFDRLSRVAIASGSLLLFDLTWEEHGEPHMCRQAQVIDVRDGRIAGVTAYCGGRWGSALMAEMGAAAVASGCA